eukprot:2481542-Rhodomonas_salina.1
MVAQTIDNAEESVHHTSMCRHCSDRSKAVEVYVNRDVREMRTRKSSWRVPRGRVAANVYVDSTTPQTTGTGAGIQHRA